jgi:hypothetical protein
MGASVAEARVQPRPTPLPGEPIPEGAYAALEAASVALRGHPPTSEEKGSWALALAYGMDLEHIARTWIALDQGRAEGVASDLYQDTLGRAPDAAGLAYWSQRLLADEAIFRLEAGFWASPELYQRAGGTDTGYVDRLYAGILGRGADAAGRDYWVGRLAAGVRRSTVALRFLNTPEVRGAKADALFRILFDRPASRAERAEWGPLLVTLGDAGRLVASRLYRTFVSPPPPGPECTLTPVPGTEGLYGATRMSDDGARVVFASEADGIVAADTDGAWDVFEWDAGTGVTTLLSTGPGDATGPSISADGGHVVWSRTTPGTGDGGDIELWERATGAITPVTTGPGNDGSPVVSDGGRFVAYVAPDPDPLPEPSPGYPWLPPTDTMTDVVVLDRTTGSATRLPEVDLIETAPSISPDGRFVAYQSSGQVPYGLGVPRPAYTAHTVARWDRTTGQATTVPDAIIRSIAPDVSDDGSIVALGQYDLSDPTELRFASTWEVASGEIDQQHAVPSGVVVSGDGGTVAFASEEPLVAGDDAGRDVFVRDVATGTVQRPIAGLDEPQVRAASGDGSVLLVEAIPVGGDGSGRMTYLCDRTA